MQRIIHISNMIFLPIEPSKGEKAGAFRFGINAIKMNKSFRFNNVFVVIYYIDTTSSTIYDIF